MTDTDPSYWPAFVRNDKCGRVAARSPAKALPLSALIDRRQLLMRAAAAVAVTSIVPFTDRAYGAAKPPPFAFEEIAAIAASQDRLPPGYERQIVIRWGDPLFADAHGFDFTGQTAERARRQFGYNNDYTAFIPLPFGSERSDHGLLVINHEYPLPQLMFPDLNADKVADSISREQVDICMTSCGVSIMEVRQRGGAWQVDTASAYNRRITAGTPVNISGPVAGHEKLRTSADPQGTRVSGTHDNCNGGLTPWGTILTCEEGSADFFAGNVDRHPDRAHMKRNHYESSAYGRYGWARFHERFDFNAEPNEPNRFEWVVEIDPFNPDLPPVKRTALGRFAHEGAHCALTADGRVVVYLGDDWEYEYCYRFVSDRRVNPVNRTANRDLLDHGTLSVARFDTDGTVRWLPLVWGQGPLTPDNGFADQADVSLYTRRAADLMGATPMDSPEGFEPDPISGHVFIALTGNEERKVSEINCANPRPANKHGHILELVPPMVCGKVDHGAEQFDWHVFLLCGNPENASDGADFHPATSANGWFVEPDNIGFDPAGRLWICSDGPGSRKMDGLWAMHTHGTAAPIPRLFYTPPIQAECCSPAFTPDGRTMFLSIQHPSEKAMNVGEALTGWPDFSPGIPPRPSVIAIQRNDGAPI
ncbi:MAG: PhoX family phosphatase [Parasphingorhabdus sp.]|uniref:PhoX family protein n=1 Tax=Parasphingorhabdus sp. TaxID=2709688 RepID=UPI003001007B